MINLIKSKNNKTRVFINTTFVITETIFDKFLFLLINIILARYFSKELFGEYTTALAYATLFSTFCDIGINGTMIRSIRRDSIHSEEHITNAFLIKTILIILSYSALCVSLFFVKYNTNIIQMILILGIVRIGDEYRKVFYAVFNSYEKFLWSSISQTLFALAFLSVTYIVIFFRGNYFHVAWSRLAVVVFFVLLLSFNILRRTKLKFSKESLKKFLPQMFYFGLSTIFSNSNKRVNTVIISMMLGTLYAGYFNNAFIFFTSIFFIPGNISRVLMPHLMKESFNNNKKKFQFTYDFYSRLFLIISFFIGIIFFLYAENIVLLVYGKKYLPSASILRVLAFALPPLFNIKSLMLTLIDKQKVKSFFEGIALTVNIAANFVFIHFFKAEGAAAASLLTYVVLNSLSGYYLSRRNYIHFRNMIPVWIKVLLVTAVTVILYYSILNRINFFISLPVISIVYWGMIMIFIACKDDIRIIKEILGKK